MKIADFTVSEFAGLNTAIADKKTLKKGVTPDQLNWITSKFSDNISLRRGQALLGTTRQTGSGKVTGIGIGVRYDGTQVPFYTHGRKVKYYNSSTADTAEISTDLLPAAASGEDVWFLPYQNLGGSFMYYGSPNSSIYKTPVANPSSVVDQRVIDYRFGLAKVSQNRMFAGQRKGTVAGNNDKTGVYLSYVDKALLSSYTSTTAEVVGSSGSQSYSGVLAFRQAVFTVTIASPGVFSQTAHGLVAGDQVVFSTTGALPTGLTAGTTYYVIAAGLTADAFEVSATEGGSAINTSGSQSGTHTMVKTNRMTCMYVAIKEASGETFLDDRNGNLVGTAGGTGTINYATGAYAVTFNAVTAGAVTADYYVEKSTSSGILDFSGSTFGQGATFRQDDGGGNLMAIWPINNVEYCMHLLKTWQLTTATSSTDTSTNLPYRNVGIPYPRAAVQTPDGIIMADVSRKTEPKFRRLQIAPNTTNLTIEPLSISDALNLTPYSYDYCVAFLWGDYEIFCVQEKINGTANSYNSIMFIRNIYSKAWDRLDFYASCLAEYNGTLLAGDPISSNVFTLFSGFDDDGEIINNYWRDGDMNLGTDHLKKVHKMVINGLIDREQSIKVSLSFDGGAFTEIYTIEGDGAYVDGGINTSIGSQIIGSQGIGGGAEATSHPFEIEFPVHSDKFETVSIKFEALGIGHAQINEYIYKDIRDKGRKTLPVHSV
jgi:hypothetical protein